MGNTVEGCKLCARELAGYEPAGGWIYRDEWWSLGALDGMDVPGWFVVEAREHVEALWEVDAAGIAAFGPLLAATSQALHETFGAERVYTSAFGENMPHWHMLIAGVPATVPAVPRGPALLIEHQHLVDADAALRVVGEVRGRLATHNSALQ